MPMRLRIFLVVAVLIGLGVVVAGWLWRGSKAGADGRTGFSDLKFEMPKGAEAKLAAVGEGAGGADHEAGVPKGMVSRLRGLFGQQGVRAGEGLLTFASEAAYRDFLTRAKAAGVSVLGGLEGLRAVRVRVEDFDRFARELQGYAGAYEAISANPILQAPKPPVAEERSSSGQVPVGDKLLATLGVTGDNSSWGKGVLIAVLDSGVAADMAFGSRLQSLDIGLGVAGSGGLDATHGTAVASLAAGADGGAGGARGVAPAADILSIRVTDTAGTSDVFTVAQAIMAAVDAGAEVINVSLGGYATAGVLARAIEYAQAGGAVVVASAGNDQAGQLVWPAAYAQVISVGAVDALGQQMAFSNSGEQLRLTAPGYAITAAAGEGKRVYFSGTSASAPVVAGAVAALLSTDPGLTAAEAAQVLQSYANDGGAAGNDPNYGNGVVNLGWAMDRNNASRVDGAVSGYNYDARSHSLEVVVQNRGARVLSGAELTVNVSGRVLTFGLSSIAPGASGAVRVPMSGVSGLGGGDTNGAVIISELRMPSGVVDQVPQNNRASATLSR